MAFPHLSPPSPENNNNNNNNNNNDHYSTPRISPPHLHNVLTSSTALQSRLGLNNPVPYAHPPLPPSLPLSRTRTLALYARLQTHALLLPASAHTTTSLRALTLTDVTPSTHDPDVRRTVLLKRLVVGERGVRELRVGDVVLVGRGEGGKWVFVVVRWGRGEREREGGGARARGRNEGRRVCFAIPERGVQILDRKKANEMGEERVEGAGPFLGPVS